MRRTRKSITYPALICFMTVLAGCAGPKKHYTTYVTPTTPVPLDAHFTVMQPAETVFQFRGELDLRQERENSAQVMYPGGGGVAGFVAAVAVHAAIQEQARKNEETEARKVADAILGPLEQALRALDFDRSLALALENQKGSFVVSEGVPDLADSPWMMGLAPVFYIPDDYSYLRVKNVVSIFSNANPDVAVYQNLIDATQEIPAGIDVNALKVEGELEPLVNSLLEESIAIALKDARHTLHSKGGVKTMKYRHGETLAYERGSLINHDCTAMSFRTLRNWVKVIPNSKLPKQSVPQDCGTTLAQK